MDTILVKQQFSMISDILPLRWLGYASGGDWFEIVRHAKSNIPC